ncbi:MAG TPA: DUF2203 domain-containing protein [Candidatus Binatia bacterium]|nr:DUF2203 domain-containing protein [Candidatus Binatia bacterium]
MPARYFTVEEANALLPKLEPLMSQLLERRARVVTRRKQLGEVLDDLHDNIGGRIPSELVQDFIAIEKLIDRIQSYGCILKDMNSGLLDFLAEREGREVYLCWRYGEPRVAYYHELHTGFNGRQSV